MEHKTSLTQHVKAPVEKVWAVLTDIPGSAATLSGVESIQMLTEGPYAEGTRWRETRTMLGRSETLELLVTQSEPPAPGREDGTRRASTTVTARQGGTEYTSRFSIAGRDGGTDLTATVAARMADPSRLGKVLMAVLGPIGMRITRKAIAKDLAEIGAKAESP